MAAISRPTLTPGRYLVQDFSIDRAFMTTDQTFIKKRQDPIIALPSGAMASVWQIGPSSHPNKIVVGNYTIKVHNMPVSQTDDDKLVAFGSNGIDNLWHIEAHRISTGEQLWSISAPRQGDPRVYYWTINFDARGYDEHGHRSVVMKAVPYPTLAQMFLLTPLEEDTEVTTQGA